MSIYGVNTTNIASATEIYSVNLQGNVQCYTNILALCKHAFNL